MSRLKTSRHPKRPWCRSIPGRLTSSVPLNRTDVRLRWVALSLGIRAGGVDTNNHEGMVVGLRQPGDADRADRANAMHDHRNTHRGRRYDLAPLGRSPTDVTLTYDWSAVPQSIREHIQFPPFGPEHLPNSLHNWPSSPHPRPAARHRAGGRRTATQANSARPTVSRIVPV
jgi:hypothetical protein